MNQDKLKLWVDALRSGEYSQTKGYLTHDVLEGGRKVHCCLGVACEVAIKNGLALEVTVDGGFTSYDNENMHLPSRVRDWLGFTETPELGEWSVIELNDEKDWTFDMIADGLEAKYLKEDK